MGSPTTRARRRVEIAPDRSGRTVAKSMIRVAAGVAAVFAITTAGGPGTAITSADPGSSRSPSGPSREGGHPRGDGDGQRGHGRSSPDGDRHGSDHPGNNRNGSDRQHGGRSGDSRGSERPGSGSSRSDGSVQSNGVSAARATSSVAVPQTATASRGAALVASETPAVAAETPSVAAATPTVPVLPVVVAGGGAVPADESTAPIVTPLVTFGDGRSPRVLSERPGEPPIEVGRPQPIIAAALRVIPAPPAPQLAAQQTAAPLPPLTMAAMPWPLSETPVTSFWGKVQSGWPASVLFGIAGLLLAPVGGMWMGHRQARAAKVASHPISH